MHKKFNFLLTYNSVKPSLFVFLKATQQVVSQVPLTTNEEFKAVVFAAKRAFPSWRNMPVTTRQRIMFKLQELIRRDMVSMAGICFQLFLFN